MIHDAPQIEELQAQLKQERQAKNLSVPHLRDAERDITKLSDGAGVLKGNLKTAQYNRRKSEIGEQRALREVTDTHWAAGEVQENIRKADNQLLKSSCAHAKVRELTEEITDLKQNLQMQKESLKIQQASQNRKIEEAVQNELERIKEEQASRLIVRKRSTDSQGRKRGFYKVVARIRKVYMFGVVKAKVSPEVLKDFLILVGR